jgi:hypothetical protein
MYNEAYFKYRARWVRKKGEYYNVKNRAYSTMSSAHKISECNIFGSKSTTVNVSQNVTKCLEFCGPQIALAYRLVLFQRGSQNSRFPAPVPRGPPPFPTLSIRPHQKPYTRGRINHRCIGGFMNTGIVL